MENVAEPQPSLWQVAKDDLSQHTGLSLLGAAVMLLWLAFQWGWGNDVLLPPISLRTAAVFDDQETWLSAALSTGAGTLAGGLFWAITQTLDGVLVLTGLKILPGITKRISLALHKQGLIKPPSELSRGVRFMIAFASGASVICLLDVFATGRPGLHGRRRLLADSVVLSVAGVAIAVATVIGLGMIGTRIPRSAATAEFLLRYASNPLTWIAIYGSIALLSSLAARLQDEPDETPELETAQLEVAEDSESQDRQSGD